MKKSILYVSIILMLVMGLVVLTGCEKEKSVTLKYGEDEDQCQVILKISGNDNAVEIEEGELDSVRIENEKENYVLDFYVDGLYATAYEEDKEMAKEDNTNFAEAKFGKYSGYTSDDYEGDIEGVILLDSKDEYGNIRLTFNLYLFDEDVEGIDLKEIYKLESVQNILNTIEYKAAK